MKVAILNSRQPLRPSGRTEWVQQTVAAVRWVAERGHTLCSSVGMQTWELTTALASMQQLPLRLHLLPSGKQSLSEDEVRRQFNLRDELLQVMPVAAGESASVETSLTNRDRQILHDADILIPVSVRAGGQVESLLHEAVSRGKQLVSEFRMTKSRDDTYCFPKADPAAIRPEIRAQASEYLIHWTRTPHGKWPGERTIDYFQAVLTSEQFPRSAFDTLGRIVGTRMLLGTPRHMPENLPAVSFSALAPVDVVPLMRWRARYAEMSFEPYGIGIRKELAESLALRPVIYYQNEKPAELSAAPWLCQSIGRKSDWREEAEYRHLGDLSLKSVADEDLMLYCRTNEEAEQLGKRFHLPVTPLF